jgi:hypothetical protein
MYMYVYCVYSGNLGLYSNQTKDNIKRREAGSVNLDLVGIRLGEKGWVFTVLCSVFVRLFVCEEGVCENGWATDRSNLPMRHL